MGSRIYPQSSHLWRASVIVPETPESEWINTFQGLPPFDPGSNELVIVSPHPDDETLGAGALIAAHRRLGLPVTVVAVTDGENAYEDYPGLGDVRIKEHTKAIHFLGGHGVNIVRLGLTDSGLSQHERALEDALTELATPDHHIIAPWTGDFHPDHEICGRIAEKVARKCKARLSWYFFWTWHRGTPRTIAGLDLRIFSFADDLLDQKLSALRCHRSQLAHPLGEPILPERLLAPAQRSFEVFAAA
jgi:LmbE family N-acetylglucosaminyl deacetylase